MVSPPARSPIAALLTSVRTALGLSVIAAIGSGFVYGWVFGGLAVVASLSIGAIVQPLLDADWEGLLSPGIDEDGGFDLKTIALASRIAHQPELLPNGDADHDPPKVYEAIDAATLDLLRRSYRYLGQPMGGDERAFRLWLGEFTTWIWQDGRWLAILPAPIVEPREGAIG